MCWKTVIHYHSLKDNHEKLVVISPIPPYQKTKLTEHVIAEETIRSNENVQLNKSSHSVAVTNIWHRLKLTLEKIMQRADRTREMPSYVFFHRILTDGNPSGEHFSVKRQLPKCWPRKQQFDHCQNFVPKENKKKIEEWKNKSRKRKERTYF